MNHYGIRLMLNPVHDLTRADLADRNAMHKRVMGFFHRIQGEAVRNAVNILWRVDETSDGMFLFVTAAEPVDEHAIPAGYALSTERYDIGQHVSQFNDGDKVWFNSTVNPTRTSTTAIGRKKRVTLTEAETYDWFHGRSPALGMAVDRLFVESSPVERLKKTSSEFTLAVSELSGTAIVADADRFRQTLIEGFGRGKAYGLGLVHAVRV